MRRTTIALLTLSLAAVVALPAPAGAAFGAVVQLPADPIYAPFGGPATVTFTFDPGDPAAVFTIRLRRPGHGTIKEKDVLVDPGTQTSPQQVSFGWKDLIASSPTGYVVDVRRQNGTVVTSEPFTLLPPLVSGVAAHPTPFYPILQDGYRDDTSIGFSLSADTTDTVVHVYEDDVYGRCCGTEVRSEDLGPLPTGDHAWIWDGERDDHSMGSKGTYFVRIEATDTGAVTDTSKAAPVELTTGTIRLTAVKEKPGSAFVAVDERQTAIGGDCNVSKDRYTDTGFVLCANAQVTLVWRWRLDAGQRIEKVSWAIDGGYYGCRKRVGHTATRSFFTIIPTSTCTITVARITYSYPVPA